MQLGIRRMFTLQATFPQLVRGSAVQDRLKVSNVLQKTAIEINEMGCTTAYVYHDHFFKNKFYVIFLPFYSYSAPVARSVNRLSTNIEYIEFNVNRPFLFLIEDETTGTLIFSGKITHPE